MDTYTDDRTPAADQTVVAPPPAPGMDALAGQSAPPPPDLSGGNPAPPSFGAGANQDSPSQGGGVGSSAPAQGQPADVQKPPSMWQRILTGALVGLAGGAGAKNFGQGMAGGAKATVDYNQQQTENDQRQQQIDIQKQEQTSRAQFMSLQAASLAVDTALKDARLHALPQEQQDAHIANALEQLKSFQAMGLTPTIVVANNKGGAEAKAGMEQLTDSHGGVPPMFTINLGDKIIGFDLNQLSGNPQALEQVNKIRQVQGQPPIDPQTWGQMPQQAKVAQTNTAFGFWNPEPTEQNLMQYKNYRDTAQMAAKGQPDNPELKANVAKLDQIVTGMQTGLDSMNKRANQQAAAKEDAQQGTKLKYEEALASFKDKLDKQNTGGTEWKPKVTADEKKKTELAENIAFNAGEVNAILGRRPDLVGIIAGRYTNVQQMFGNDDPDINSIATHIHNIAMANSGVHGFRSQEGVEATEHNLLNGFKNGPKAVAGALAANTTSVQTFIDNARPDTYPTNSKNGGAYAAYTKTQQTTAPTAPAKDNSFVGLVKGGKQQPQQQTAAPSGQQDWRSKSTKVQ